MLSNKSRYCSNIWPENMKIIKKMNRGKTVKNLAVAALRWHAKKLSSLAMAQFFMSSPLEVNRLQQKYRL